MKQIEISGKSTTSAIPGLLFGTTSAIPFIYLFMTYLKK